MAINLPEEVKRELYYLGLAIEHQAETARVVPPENHHITLLFIGETERIQDAKECLQRLRGFSEPLDLQLEGIGSFKQQRARSWWVGVRPNNQLGDLQKELYELYRAADFPLESRAFKPHITIARNVKATQPLRIDAPGFSITARCISLMKSVHENGRMVYTEIDSLEI